MLDKNKNFQVLDFISVIFLVFVCNRHVRPAYKVKQISRSGNKIRLISNLRFKRLSIKATMMIDSHIFEYFCYLIV